MNGRNSECPFLMISDEFSAVTAVPPSNTTPLSAVSKIPENDLDAFNSVVSSNH